MRKRLLVNAGICFVLAVAVFMLVDWGIHAAVFLGGAVLFIVLAVFSEW